MNVWIEQCKQFCHGLSWEGVASLVKESHRNGDTNITQREIDLEYGLKHKHASILINHIYYLINFNYIDVQFEFFYSLHTFVS